MGKGIPARTREKTAIHDLLVTNKNLVHHLQTRRRSLSVWPSLVKFGSLVFINPSGISWNTQPTNFIFAEFLFGSEVFLPHHAGKDRRKVMRSPGPRSAPLFQ